MSELSGIYPSWSVCWQDTLGRESEIESDSAGGWIEDEVPGVICHCVDGGGVRSDGVDDACLWDEGDECE